MKPIQYKLLGIRAFVLTCTAVVGLLAIHTPADAQQKKTIAVAVKLAAMTHIGLPRILWTREANGITSTEEDRCRRN